MAIRQHELNGGISLKSEMKSLSDPFPNSYPFRRHTLPIPPNARLEEDPSECVQQGRIGGGGGGGGGEGPRQFPENPIL